MHRATPQGGSADGEGKFGSMVSYQNNAVLDAPIADAVYRISQRLAFSDHSKSNNVRQEPATAAVKEEIKS